MTAWTGYLYGHYSNQPIELFYSKLISYYEKSFDLKAEMWVYEDEQTLLFYSSEQVLLDHQEFGYNINENGVGCVGVEAKPVEKLNAITMLHTFDNDSNFKHYDISLVFNNIFYYTLVLPEPAESCQFSNAMLESFKKLLLE